MHPVFIEGRLPNLAWNDEKGEICASDGMSPLTIIGNPIACTFAVFQKYASFNNIHLILLLGNLIYPILLRLILLMVLISFGSV